jgi:hypothetical protein
VPKRLFRPPAHLVDQWPEVFDDMLMNSMPLAYLKTIKLEFEDGRIWHISIEDLLLTQTSDDIIENLLNILDDLSITNIDFDIDVDKLRKDISIETKKLF